MRWGASGISVRFNQGPNMKHACRTAALLLSVVVLADPASNRLMGLSVASYLADAKDTVALNVRFLPLQDGTRYPATEDLARSKNLSINVTNSGYRKTAQ